MARIAINGFGRIGRQFFRAVFGDPNLEIVAVNDLTDTKTLAYLLQYDSAYGRYGKKTDAKEGSIIVDGKEIHVYAEKDPTMLPWAEKNIDVVVESTGFFTDADKASAHLRSGAKRAVITAPAKGDLDTALIGVNDDLFEKGTKPITCNGSCTTNASAPVVQILKDSFGIKKAFLQTVHGYTATQKLVDGPDAKDMRRGRAAAANIVPSTTGAAESVLRSVAGLDGVFDGVAIRVPVLTGSLVMITALLNRVTTADEINAVFRAAAKDPRWLKSLAVSEDPIVSSDIVGQPYGAIIDTGLTKVVDGDLTTIFSWYDNEAGYTATLVEHVRRVAGR